MTAADPPASDQPLDSDLEGGSVTDRPPHQRIGHLLVVWFGGCLGTASRFVVNRAVPQPLHLPLGTFMINIVGALLLGVLLARLAAGGADRGRRRVVRLAVGTGFLGGFTTYSALAVDTVALTLTGRAGWGTAYALATVLVGVTAAGLGLTLGGRRERAA
jgi:CrcB protein